MRKLPRKITDAVAYSLVELLIVVTLFMLLAMIAVPSTGFFKRSVLQSELEKLSMLSMYVHRCALATAQEQTLFFDAQTHTYSYQGITRSLVPGVRFDFLPDTYGPPTAPKKPIAKPVTFKEQTLVCSPQGAMSAGTVYLTDNEHSCMYALTVPAGAVPYVRKYRLDKSQWVLIR